MNTRYYLHLFSKKFGNKSYKKASISKLLSQNSSSSDTTGYMAFKKLSAVGFPVFSVTGIQEKNLGIENMKMSLSLSNIFHFPFVGFVFMYPLYTKSAKTNESQEVDL